MTIRRFVQLAVLLFVYACKGADGEEPSPDAATDTEMDGGRGPFDGAAGFGGHANGGSAAGGRASAEDAAAGMGGAAGRNEAAGVGRRLPLPCEATP